MSRQVISFQKATKHKKIAQATEQALKVINSYENKSSIFPSFHPYNQTYHNQEAYIKQLSFGQVIRIQLLQNSEDFYRASLKNLYSQSQIIIKNIRGQKMVISIDFDKNIYPCQQKCFASYIIQKQTIIPVPFQEIKEKQWLNVSIKSLSPFLMFSLRIDKTSKINTLRFNPKSLRQKSLKSEASELQLSRMKQTFMEKNKKSKKWGSQSKLPNPKSLTREYSPQYKKMRLMNQKEKYEQKQQQALAKKQKANIYKQKIKQYSYQAAKCLRVIQAFEKRQKQKLKQKYMITKMLSAFIYQFKFIQNTNQIYEIKKMEIQTASKLKYHINTFIVNMRKVYIQNVRFIGNKRARTLSSVKFMSTLTAKITNNNASKVSSKIVCEVISKLHAGFKINHAFQYANNYRRKVRHIQKYWVSLYKARTEILLYYGNKMINKYIKANEKLKIGQQKMKENNKMSELCKTYQAQEANRILGYFQEYKQKIQEKKNILKKNQQIRNFNKTCLQKYIKKQIQVPLDPSLPQFRFFRNAGYFKTMVKTQLQVATRRANRQMKKLQEAQQLAKKQQNMKKQKQQQKNQHKKSIEEDSEILKGQKGKNKKSNSKSKIVINMLKL